MQESNIEHNNTTDKPVELSQEQKKIIESKLQNALLKVLIENGGEVVLLKPLQMKQRRKSPFRQRQT